MCFFKLKSAFVSEWILRGLQTLYTHSLKTLFTFWVQFWEKCSNRLDHRWQVFSSTAVRMYKTIQCMVSTFQVISKHSCTMLEGLGLYLLLCGKHEWNSALIFQSYQSIGLSDCFQYSDHCSYKARSTATNFNSQCFKLSSLSNKFLNQTSLRW